MNTGERRASQHCNPNCPKKGYIQKYCCTYQTNVQHQSHDSSTLMIQHRIRMYETVNNQRTIIYYSWRRLIILLLLCVVRTRTLPAGSASLPSVSCAGTCSAPGSMLYVPVERASETLIGDHCYCFIRIAMIEIYMWTTKTLPKQQLQVPQSSCVV